MADGHADIEQVTALLKQAIDDNASDVFLIPGAPVTFKVGETHQPHYSFPQHPCWDARVGWLP